MEQWRKDARRETVITDLEALVPANHLLRQIEKIMDFERLYEQLDSYYCHTNGRPGTDPVVLVRMVLIQHLFGIPSLRQTYARIRDSLACCWFLGYGLLDNIPHFVTQRCSSTPGVRNELAVALGDVQKPQLTAAVSVTGKEERKNEKDGSKYI